MITVDNLPRDINAVVQGAWRLVHEDPNFNGDLGAVRLVNGVATSPVAGRQLRCVVAEYGGKLFLEPWGDLPTGFVLPELVRATVSEEQLAKLERAPWREAVAEALMPLTLELLKLAGEGGPADFAVSMAAVPEIPDADLVAARTEYFEHAAKLRADGYVEIPKALDGAIALLDERLAKLPNETTDLAPGLESIALPDAPTFDAAELSKLGATTVTGLDEAPPPATLPLEAQPIAPTSKSLADQIGALKSKKDAVAFGEKHGVPGLSEDAKLADLKARLVSSLVPHEPQPEAPKPS